MANWKYRTLYIFLLLISVWSVFFSSVKYFLWGDVNSIFDVDLETLAWYLSFWWIFSYLIWWAMASTFLKKYMLFVLSIMTLIFVIIAYVFWINSNFWLWFIVSFIWFFYWLWSVLKNIIISIEIKKTWLADTKVNAYAGIIFIIFIILWSIWWSLLFEKLWHNWYVFLIFLMIVSALVSLWLDYDNIKFSSLLTNWFHSYVYERKHKLKQSMKEYFPELKYVIKNYSLIMIVSSLFWAISTIVSQQAIDYSKAQFWMLWSEAAFILLYSAFWAIIWTFLSIKMQNKRWLYFLITWLIFCICVFLFPSISVSYNAITIMAFVIWLFFWAASNLLDAYFFNKIWEDNKKEYWASTYWLVLSLVIFIMMFISSFISKSLWFNILMYVLWCIIFVCLVFIYMFNYKKWN